MGRMASLIAVAVVVAEAFLVASHMRLAVDKQVSIIRAPITVESAVFTVRNAGSDLPSTGRSLFDQLVGSSGDGWYVPFPFSKLLASLSHAGGCADDCYQAVMIPLGRSLQRTAAAPDFFKFPRKVVAFNRDAKLAGYFPLLKDRLYLGYQEKTNLIEVISFNETSGRFEFQFVKNYGAGLKPQVSYANRSVCTSCHQNQAPIFSRQVWDETNANPEIAKRLADARRDFDGLPVRVGVDVPNVMDDATDRANLLPAYELLWRDGCGDNRSCRARALAAALQYRLTGERSFDFQSTNFQQDFLAPFKKNWQTRWPNGLQIPSNDIPNRDPLQSADSERLAHVPTRFEALQPRGHKEIWQWETDRFRLIKGIGEFFSIHDINLIASKLGMSLDSTIATDAMLKAFAALDQAVEVLLGDREGQAAFDSLTIQREPLRNALFRALGIVDVRRCCDQYWALPPEKFDDEEVIATAPADARLSPFYAHCARCHATREAFPPNFMHGAPDAVSRNLRRCADRIYFRLTMWQMTPELRPKTPMPPEASSPMYAAHWVESTALTAMRNYIAPYADTSLKLSPEKWLGRSYEALPSCTLH
jgi:hypothetical protein